MAKTSQKPLHCIVAGACLAVAVLSHVVATGESAYTLRKYWDHIRVKKKKISSKKFTRIDWKQPAEDTGAWWSCVNSFVLLKINQTVQKRKKNKLAALVCFLVQWKVCSVMEDNVLWLLKNKKFSSATVNNDLHSESLYCWVTIGLVWCKAA